MRCDEITREIATPTGRLTPEQVYAHLMSCPRCADWSAQATQLDQILNETRPKEPTTEAFDALWSQVTAAVDAPQVLPFRRVSGSRRSFWTFALLANAAAVMLMFFTVWYNGRHTRSETVSAPGPGPASLVSRDLLNVVPIEQDTTCVIRINDSGIEVDRIRPALTAPLMALSVDVIRANDTDALNFLESMAE